VAKNFRVEFNNLVKVRKAYLEAPEKFMPFLALALNELAEDLLDRALPITPIKTGALRGSGTVIEPVIEKNRVASGVGFGGDAKEYAVWVHENLDPATNWTEPNTGPKYLEMPTMELAEVLPAYVEQRLALLFEA
jgi:hypothetical protein